MSPEEARRVEEAADSFERRFRETLDFGNVFDQMFVPDAIKRLRGTSFFRGININRQLVEKLDDATLERVYKAIMNYYYLSGVYDLSVAANKGGQGRGSNSPPPEVAAAVRASEFCKLLSDEGNGDSPTITKKQELERFITDLNNVAALYKARLPQNSFNTKRTSLIARWGLRVENGYEDFGIREGVKIYVAEQNLFALFFVEQNGDLKILTLGMGN
jgi:hypothetical protein